MKFLNRKDTHILFYLFISIYSFLLLFLAYSINIWEDEAYTLNTTSNNLGNVISESYGFEGQPPFYFILLAIWRLISPGIFFARLFSILFIGLSAYVLYRIVPLISDLKNPNWIIIIFLLNPFTVWAALEIRTYALLIFLSTVAVYSILRYYIKSEKRYLYLFLIISLIGLYTQYYFVFLIAAIAFSLLIYNGWKSFFHLSLYLTPVVILFLPNLYFIQDNVKNFQSFSPDYSIIHRFSALSTAIQSITLGINLLADIRILKWCVRITFVLMAIVSYLKFHKKYYNDNRIIFYKYNLILLITFLSLAFFTLFVLKTGMYFNVRYLAITFPLIILLFIIFDWHSVIVRNFIYGIISIYFIFLLSFRYAVPIKNYDYESIAKHIERIEKPNEPVLLNSRTISTPFQYYYSGINNLIQLPDTFKLEKEGFQVLLRDTLDFKWMLENINSESILFINDNMIGYPPKLLLTSDILDDHINSQFIVTLDTLLFGKSNKHSLRIRRLENRITPNSNRLNFIGND